MNFLAHIYLSGDNDLVKIGNFMADGIRGGDFSQYPEDVQTGIRLHRAIDTFTDAHPLFRRGTKRLHEQYHHYAGVVMDVFYDHFLARDWHRYSAEKLEDYAASFYRLLENRYDLLTDRVKSMLPIMKKHNWLVSYATIEGISQIFYNMDRRTGGKSKMASAAQALREHYEELEREFPEFFEDIRAMARQQLTT